MLKPWVFGCLVLRFFLFKYFKVLLYIQLMFALVGILL